MSQAKAPGSAAQRNLPVIDQAALTIDIDSSHNTAPLREGSINCTALHLSELIGSIQIGHLFTCNLEMDFCRFVVYLKKKTCRCCRFTVPYPYAIYP